MSKRRTIGANPLDLVVSENHLEAMVAGPLATREAEVPGPKDNRLALLEQRLKGLESENKRLEMQLGELRMEMADLKNQAFRNTWWLSQVKQKLGVK